MSDIYLSEDAENLLLNKFIVIIGDSIHRSIYKDLVVLLQKNQFMNDKQLRCKGENKFENDDLLVGGKKIVLNNGPNYREVREYRNDYHLIRFYFVTRCYNKYVDAVLKELSEDPKPDVIIMNSCLWDITRYGPNSVPQYKKNLKKLCEIFSKSLPNECLILWNTSMPISKSASGGFLIPELEVMNSSLRLDILEANFYSQQVISAHGYDVLDLHYYLRHHLHRRAEDGIHWDMTAHRRITNLLLTHIAEAWGEPLPGRIAEVLESNIVNIANNNAKMKATSTPLQQITQELFKAEPSTQMQNLKNVKNNVGNNNALNNNNGYKSNATTNGGGKAMKRKKIHRGKKRSNANSNAYHPYRQENNNRQSLMGMQNLFGCHMNEQPYQMNRPQPMQNFATDNYMDMMQHFDWHPYNQQDRVSENSQGHWF